MLVTMDLQLDLMAQLLPAPRPCISWHVCCSANVVLRTHYDCM